MANKRKKNKSLTKRVETLENQLFGQKLLTDDLESKLETLEKKLEAFLNPTAPWYPNITVPAVGGLGIGTKAPQQPLVITTTTGNTADPCVINGHNFVNSICTVCKTYDSGWYVIDTTLASINLT